MAFEDVEQFRILFLDKKNRLIADEVQQNGTVDHTPVYPREVIKRTLELSATALILVHNHPSGDPSPSTADVQMTRQIIDVAKPLGVTRPRPHHHRQIRPRLDEGAEADLGQQPVDEAAELVEPRIGDASAPDGDDKGPAGVIAGPIDWRGRSRRPMRGPWMALGICPAR